MTFPVFEELEDELASIRNQIKEKTALLDRRGVRIANLCKCFTPVHSEKRNESSNSIRVLKVALCVVVAAQIMDLHMKIGPLENELSAVKGAHSQSLTGTEQTLAFISHEVTYILSRWLYSLISNSFSELQNRLRLRERQLKDAESQLQQANSENFKNGENIVVFVIWRHVVGLLLTQNNSACVCVSASDGDC